MKNLYKVMSVIAHATLILWALGGMFAALACLFVESTNMFALAAFICIYGFPVVMVVNFVAMALESRW